MNLEHHKMKTNLLAQYGSEYMCGAYSFFYIFIKKGPPLMEPLCFVGEGSYRESWQKSDQGYKGVPGVHLEQTKLNTANAISSVHMYCRCFISRFKINFQQNETFSI